MKVGILTFPNSTSYGASLQMYALYYTVKKLGHDAEIINYHNPYMKAGKHMTKAYAQRSLRDVVRFRARAVLHRRLEKNFRDFEKQNTKLFPARPITHKARLSLADTRYDAIICGSDQVWNPNITDSDLSYFLDFCTDNTRRIAYAPSFGVDCLDGGFASAVSLELKRFAALSVRERSGQSLMEEMTGQVVPIVVDPSMLLDAGEWSAQEREHPLGRGKYILFYTVRNSPSLFSYCRALSEKTGMKIVIIGGNAIKKMQNRDPMMQFAVDVSPAEWLYLIHHAHYVVTNSFHGTAFSIIYRKNFYVEFSSDTNSRLAHITEMLGLQDRVVKNGMCDDDLQCDYSVAESKLPALCLDSMRYLEDALREEVSHG